MTLASAVPILLASLLVTVADAQPASGSFSLGGLVVNTNTGEPVNRALVHIMQYPKVGMPPRGAAKTAPPAPSTYSTFTDMAGVFRFEALSAGRSSIWVEKPQFAPEDIGRREVDLSTSIGDITLKIAPLGVITGKVVDQNGEPMRGVNVVGLTTQIVEGFRQSRTDRSVTTDDRGMYRFWGLHPGKYYIKAAGRSGGTNLYAGDSTPQYFADEGFQPAYFGGGRSMDSATIIPIAPGTEVHADVSVKLEPAFKIRGSLANFAPRRTVRFELLSGEEDVSVGRVSVNGDTGRFEVQYVVPGSYILIATQDDASAELPVTVRGADVNGVTLPLAGGVDVKGVVRVPNRQSNDSLSAGLQNRGMRTCAVSLYPARGRSGPPHRSTGGEGDAFAFPGVTPGLYRVTAQCFGAYIQSVTSGTQNLLANPTLSVPPGASPPPIEVTAFQGGGRIHGRVPSEPSLKQLFVHVLVVPQFADSGGPVVAPGFGQPGSSGGFPFSVGPLAPGVYVLYAFLNADDVEYRNPQFLSSLTGGVSVQVEDGSDKEINITDVIR